MTEKFAGSVSKAGDEWTRLVGVACCIELGVTIGDRFCCDAGSVGGGIERTEG